jgi:hypothetical protein
MFLPAPPTKESQRLTASEHAPDPRARGGARAGRPAHETSGRLRVELEAADIPALCERLRILLEQGAVEVVCDVGAASRPRAEIIDALCRLQLTARRLGGRIRLGDASAELADLLAFLGLGDVFAADGLCVEAERQAEERKELLRVEEERDPLDPVA